MTNEFPFEGQNKEDIYYSILFKKVNYNQHKIFNQYSPELIEILKNMLKKNPQFRPSA